MDIETLALSKKFTKDTAEGMGAVKGSPCTVKSTAYDDNGNTVVTFAWKDTNNVEHTQTATIKRGLMGDSIVDCSVNEDTGEITFVTRDGESLTPIVIPLSDTVIQNKKDIALLQETVKTLGGSVTLKVVTDLPTTDIKTSVIYLKTTTTEGKYDQYIWTIEDGTGSWTSLGPTEANLSEYFKKENIVMEFSETTSYTKVPSEKLVKDEFDSIEQITTNVHCDIGNVRLGEVENTTLGEHSHIMGFTSSSKSDPVLRYINYKADGKTSKERLLISYESSTEDLLIKGNANDKSTEFRLSNYAKKTDVTIQHYVTQDEYDEMESAGTLVADDDYNIIEE